MYSRTFSIASETDMLAFSEQLAKLSTAGIIIFLYGTLGAGKTTFARGFLRGLGHQGKVKSPTYTLVEPYHLKTQTIFHFDLYRLNNAQELAHIGIEEYFSQNAICLIEWPEKAAALLPPPDLSCYIEFHNGGRLLKLTTNTECGRNILKNL